MSITGAFSKDKKLEWRIITPISDLSKEAVFYDVFDPTPDEVRCFTEKTGITVPSQQDLGMSEVIRPFYKENGVCYMTITVIHQTESSDYWESSPLAFILSDRFLIMLSHVRLTILQIFFERSRNNFEIYLDPDLLLTSIIDVLINNIAVILQDVGNDLDDLLKRLFVDEKNARPLSRITSNKYYDDIIEEIGLIGNVISKTRESLVSINRLILYYDQIEENKDITQIRARREQRLRLRHLSREISSLSEYAGFLSQRNSFLIDATLGMLSVEQNTIIKMFTVASAVLMPPTLIASIYGMNFNIMPELTWKFGYPLAIIMIIISALVPYFYFKKKNWL
ncbi:CorA family divalent cation transporter [Lyticum sinuosum]|uniref:Magnesium transport protein CorA n=1 Tax=Lyticum sinuosum TaxID=1332059 RepID=A0AAE4VJX1_9RICK|nr:CorA family divalent cation transporter [Lyticum sinuosum]MDZ5761127.1 Magnesium transport protein CorA [Lyticum sinuosum]